MAAKKRGRQGAKRTTGKDSDEKETLSPAQRLMKAMAHPLRFQLLTLLNDREWSPSELADELAEGLSQVSYHVGILRDFECVELTRTEPRRGAVQHFYRATQRSMITLEMAGEIPQSAHHTLVDDALAEIKADVNEAITGGRFVSRIDGHVVRIPMIFDEQGCKDGHAIGDEYIAKMLRVAGESACRLGLSDDPQPIGMTAVLLVFPSAQAEREKELPKKRRRK